MTIARYALAVSLLAACSDDGPGAVPADVAETDAETDGGDATDTPEDGQEPDAVHDTDSDDAPDSLDAGDATDAVDTAETLDDTGDTDTSPDGDAGPSCGNGVLETGEQCDLGELGDQTCTTLGLTEGLLTCGADCTFRTGQCAICPNAICEGAEDLASCPADCRAVDVGVGRDHSCVVLGDGSVRCWGGSDGHRAGGLSDVGLPTPIAGLSGMTVVEVAAGDAHTCVRTATGEVWCWGRNGFGESAPDSEAVSIWPPQRVDGLPAVQSLALGRSHACAVASTDGSVWCWGRAVFGAVGHTVESSRRAVPAQVAFPAGMSVDSVTAGADHTCAWQAGGRAWCWGRSDQHQVGGPDPLWQFSPRQVSGFSFVAGVGTNHSCATVINLAAPPQFSGLFCWGSNAYGQLGREPTDDFIGAQRIFAARPSLLDGGDGFTCTVEGDSGAVSCWGANEVGQLGDGTLSARFAPAPTATLGAAARVLDAGARHACVVLEDGGVRCWGDNRRGQIGVDTVLEHHATPVAPIGFGGAP